MKNSLGKLSADKKKIFTIIGLIIGITTIILGIIFLTTAPGLGSGYIKSTSPVTFGGDFYTEIHEAASDISHNTHSAANNIHDLARNVAMYSGSAFIIFGLLISLFFTKELLCSENSILSNAIPSSSFNLSESEVITNEADTTEEATQYINTNE